MPMGTFQQPDIAVKHHMLGVDCKRCGKRDFVHVPTNEFFEWMSGQGYIQDLMPHLDADRREMLMMNWCYDCVISVYSTFEEQRKIEEAEDAEDA